MMDRSSNRLHGGPFEPQVSAYEVDTPQKSCVGFNKEPDPRVQLCKKSANKARKD